MYFGDKEEIWKRKIIFFHFFKENIFSRGEKDAFWEGYCLGDL